MAIVSVSAQYVGPIGRYAAAPVPAGPMLARGAGPLRWRAGLGGGVITDVVTVNGQPVGRRVQAYLQSSGELVAQTWSDPLTGVYTFTGLATGTFFRLVADDHTGVRNSAAGAYQLAS